METLGRPRLWKIACIVVGWLFGVGWPTSSRADEEQASKPSAPPAFVQNLPVGLSLQEYHPALAALALGEEEARLWKEIETYCGKKKRPLPAFDPGLQRVARLLAKKLSQEPSPVLGHGWVEAAMRLYGQSDVQIQIFAMGWEDEALLHRSLQTSLGAMLEQHGATDVGIAIQGKKPKVAMILFIRRGLRFQPTPARITQGQTLTFRGTVQKGFALTHLVVGHFDASTQTHLIVPSKEGVFAHRFVASEQGKFRIQWLAQDSRGPWISAQWEITVVAASKDIPLAENSELRQITARLSLRPSAGVSASSLDPAIAAQELSDLVSELRKENGLEPLHRHPRLDRFALEYAREMTKYGFFGHTSPRTGSFETRFRRLAWPADIARENLVIASTPKEALRLLTDSPAHRSNLYAPLLVWTGIAASRTKQGRLVFVQVFVSSP